MIRHMVLFLTTVGVALALAGMGAGAPALGAASSLSLSLGPWTGPQLPGSIPETLKYRLTVGGRPGETVELRAADVPKGWVATFCTEHLCTPNHSRLTLPASRVKIVEFQLVPPDAGRAAPKVRVLGSSRDGEATATT
ncbi:MAG: hypothetical protein GIX01_04030 [Candidatus Eremiobacteraeota bacterium]|nr:hypothetical protein [Candidatus Eremiobacteraeota bacterium]